MQKVVRDAAHRLGLDIARGAYSFDADALTFTKAKWLDPLPTEGGTVSNSKKPDFLMRRVRRSLYYRPLLVRNPSCVNRTLELRSQYVHLSG